MADEDKEKEAPSKESLDEFVIEVSGLADDDHQAIEVGDTVSEGETVERQLDANDNNYENGEMTPSNDSEVAPNTTEEGKTKKSLIIGIVIASVLALLAVSGFFIKTQADKKAARNAEIESYNEYIGNLQLLAYTAIKGGAEAETAANLVLKVWHNAIYEDEASAWDEESRPYYSTDFNDSLNLLYQSELYQGYIENIEASVRVADKCMTSLKNPPAGCEYAYQTAQTLYTEFKTMTDLAIDPSGSYKSFSEEFSATDSDLIKTYELLMTQIPEEKPVE